jgi:hypothetical protein
VALLTPVVKAFFTDAGSEVANIGVQVFGGHGYIREHGMEQFVRDARIAQLYEGTNGVQALDLVGRKLPQDMGRLPRRFFHPVSAFLEEARAKPELASFVGPLAQAFGKLQQATALIARRGLKDPDEAGAAATDYLRLFALVTLGYLWARMAEVAAAKLAAGEGEARFYDNKVKTAAFFFAKLLPQTDALLKTIQAGSETLMAVEADAF